MSENKDNLVYIRHVLEAIGQIETYLNGVDFVSFSANRMIFDAVTRQLEIIGEASSRIDDQFKKLYPDIPWRKVIGTRNKIIHEYFNIDKNVVWQTCQEDIPELKSIFQNIISQAE